MKETSVLWRRIDSPGHDACWLHSDSSGWRLEGTAVFLHERGASRISYELTCDPSWHALHGSVAGRVGDTQFERRFARAELGGWTANDIPVPGLDSCIDLDFGFTPASNLPPIRRLALAPGQAADAPAAWLSLTTGDLRLLAQRYERRSDSAYWYEAPGVGYAALLEVSSTGFILKYPGLWEAEMGSALEKADFVQCHDYPQNE